MWMFSAVYAIPVPIRDLIAKVPVAIHVATIKIALITDEEHMFVIPQSTLVARIIVILRIEDEFLLFY
jgi:hypothetical protein